MKYKFVVVALLCVAGICNAQAGNARFSSFTLRTPIEMCGTWTGEGYAAFQKASSTLYGQAETICSPGSVVPGTHSCYVDDSGSKAFFQDFSCGPNASELKQTVLNQGECCTGACWKDGCCPPTPKCR